MTRNVPPEITFVNNPISTERNGGGKGIQFKQCVAENEFWRRQRRDLEATEQPSCLWGTNMQVKKVSSVSSQ